MARIELNEKAQKQWEDSLKTDDFLSNESIINETKVFLTSYESANEEQKKALLQSIFQSFAKIMNVKISKLNISDKPITTCSGFFERQTQSITIFPKRDEENFVFSAEILTTLLHELRHAYQNQYIIKENTELGKVMRHYHENYITSNESNFMETISYRTNFTEVDAQRFSFKVAKELAEEVLNRSKNENRFRQKVLQVKVSRIKADSKQFEDNYQKNIEIVKNMDSIFNQLKEYFITMIANFYSADMTKEEEMTNSTLISDSLYQFINSKSFKTINNISLSDKIEIYKDILSNINPEDLVTKINNPLTEYLQKLGNSFEKMTNLSRKTDNNLIIYNGYFDKLKEGLEFGKIFLNKFNIQYNKKDNKNLYLTYSDNSFKYLSTLFADGQFSEFDKMLSENLIALETRDPKNFSRQKIVDNIIAKYPEKKIKELLRLNIDNDSNNEIINTFHLNSFLLDGYGSCYLTEKTNNLYSNFLKFAKIPFDSSNFDDILSKFNKNYPIFISNCLTKKELSDDEIEFIYNSNFYSRNNKSMIKKYISAIKKQYSKEEIVKLFETGTDNHIVSLLIQNGVTIDDINNDKTLDSSNTQPSQL